MRQRVLACFAALAGVAMIVPAAEAGPARSTIDRPDDAAGPQVHYVYAVPRGGTDRGLDKKGAIAASIDAQQQWFERESGGARIRVDTFRGEPDVTFVALPLTIRQLLETDDYRAIRDHLETRGMMKADKKYVVYYEGPPGRSGCGISDGGSIGVVYFGSDCVQRDFGNAGANALGLARPGEEPRVFDFTALHELIHAMGFVPRCAPNYDASGAGLHTTGPKHDLMMHHHSLSGIKLDPGRDDYFGHGRANCPDLAKSVYLTTNKAPAVAKAAAALSIRSARASFAGTRLALRAEIAGLGENATAECRLMASGVPGSSPAAAVIRGSGVDCGWQVRADLIQAWKQRLFTLRVEVVVRSNGHVARRSVTVRPP